MRNILFAVAAAAILAVSCEPEQSELNMSSIKNQAKIVGTVKYNSGTVKNDDASFTENVMLKASGAEVVARIAYSSYGGGSGNYVVKTTTNANGDYTLTVPVGNSSINVTVECLPFYKTKNVKDDENNIQPISKALYNIFTYNPAGGAVSLASEQIKTVNIEATSSATLE